MAIANDEPNRLAINALELQPTDRVLELGFGPGWGLRTIAAHVPMGKYLELTNLIECFSRPRP
jgi:hypothetical protein